MLEASRRVARNTPIQLEAARATEQQASARYKAGLTSIVEVAEAERILTQAEIDDALARLSVWRALLAIARGRAACPLARRGACARSVGRLSCGADGKRALPGRPASKSPP